jgi:hypothetical protein
VLHVLLDIGFAAICAVLVAQTIVLLDVLRRTVRIKTEVYAAMPEVEKHDRLAGGTLVEFEAPDLRTGATLRSTDLLGAPVALFFIAPDETETPDDWLLDTLAGLRHRGEGRLFVLCDGRGAACAEVSRVAGPDVPVLLDQEGRIRGRFLVSTTPAAVLLDSEARVAQYGMPDHVPEREEEAV